MTHKIAVNQETCIGCGACVATCPVSFKMDGTKAKPIKAEIETITCEEDAKVGCPVDSISIN